MSKNRVRRDELASLPPTTLVVGFVGNDPVLQGVKGHVDAKAFNRALKAFWGKEEYRPVSNKDLRYEYRRAARSKGKGAWVKCAPGPSAVPFTVIDWD